jgi:very-short-patch-repair endonuclease
MPRVSCGTCCEAIGCWATSFVGKYFLVFVCLGRKLFVELDGGQHQEKADYDNVRTHWLESPGYRVMRFWNSEVVEDRDGLQERILEALEEESS